MLKKITQFTIKDKKHKQETKRDKDGGIYNLK